MSLFQDQSSKYIHDPKLRYEFIEGYAPRPCPQRLKLMSFVDMHEDQRFDDPFVKHLENCQECREQYLMMGREFEQLNRVLPWIKASPKDLEHWRKKIQQHSQAISKRSQFQKRLEIIDVRDLLAAIQSVATQPKWLLVLSLAFIVTIYLVNS